MQLVREGSVGLCGEAGVLRVGSPEGLGREGVCLTLVLSLGVWSEEGSGYEKGVVGGVGIKEGFGF